MVQESTFFLKNWNVTLNMKDKNVMKNAFT